MGLTVTLSHDAAVFERLRLEWEQLQDDSAAAGIYLTWDWITLFWQHFGDDGALWLLEVRDETGVLVGIGPFMRVETSPFWGIRWRQLQFIGTLLNCEHLDFLSQRGYEQRVMDACLAYLTTEQDRWDVLLLSHLIDQAPTLAFVRESSGIQWQVEEAMIVPVVSLPEDWDTFFSALGKDKRWKQRRFRRKLDEQYPDGRWSWRLVDDDAALDAALDELIALHQAFWTARGQPGAFAGQRAAFFAAVAHRFLARGWLELSRLEFDHQLAASLLAYCYRGRVYHFNTGIDHAFEDLHSGHILVEMALRNAIQNGAAEYDFLWGDEQYKYQWGAETRRNWNALWVATRRARLEQQFIRSVLAIKSLLRLAVPAGWRKRAKQFLKRLRER